MKRARIKQISYPNQTKNEIQYKSEGTDAGIDGGSGVVGGDGCGEFVYKTEWSVADKCASRSEQAAERWMSAGHVQQENKKSKKNKKNHDLPEEKKMSKEAGIDKKDNS